jgi:hypothetical protein
MGDHSGGEYKYFKDFLENYFSVLVILTWGFQTLRRKTTGADRKRTTLLMSGFLFFGIAALMENTLGDLGDIAKICARAVMLASYICIYLGFSSTAARKLDNS